MISRRKHALFVFEYAAFRFVGFVFGALPLETASALSGWFWRVVAPATSRHKRALRNLALAFPEKSTAERERIARGMWENLGRVFAETFHLAEFRHSGRVFVEPYEEVKRLAQGSRATVFCAPHMGNWELVVLGIVIPGLRPSGIYRRLKNPYVDAYVKRLRQAQYPAGLLPKDPSTPKRLMRIARDGGTVAFLADLHDRQGLEVPFFGTPAASSIFPIVVARACSARLFAGYLLREPNVRFRAFMEEIAVPKTADRDADIAEATANLQAAFERAIRTAPEQWMWAHRRWG